MNLFHKEATLFTRIKGCLILIIIAIGIYTIIRVIEAPTVHPVDVETKDK